MNKVIYIAASAKRLEEIGHALVIAAREASFDRDDVREGDVLVLKAKEDSQRDPHVIDLIFNNDDMEGREDLDPSTIFIDKDF